MLITRLQTEASRHPGLYRLRLVAIAVAGDIALSTVQVMFVALPIGIGMLMFDNRYLHWLGAGAILLLIWLIGPTYRLEGRELTPEEAPALFAEISVRAPSWVPGKTR